MKLYRWFILIHVISSYLFKLWLNIYIKIFKICKSMVMYTTIFFNELYFQWNFKNSKMHPLIWFVMKFLLKFSTNGYPFLFTSRWWVMSTCCWLGPWIIHHPQKCTWYQPCKMVHSKMWNINYMPRDNILAIDNFFTYFFFSLFLE